MKKYLYIILLFGVCFGQDKYPYFSDPKMQMKFEENRVYIIERNGKEQIISGGGSYTELANEFGTIFLDESPEYVTTYIPITTSYIYNYEFKIKIGKNLLTELEFLIKGGYDSKAREVYENYEKQMNPYREDYKKYQKQMKFYEANNKSTTEEMVFYEQNCFTYCFMSYGLLGALTLYIGIVDDSPEDVAYGLKAMVPGIFGYFISYASFPQKYNKTFDSLSEPKQPTEPYLKQVLSNEQIKSLAESYNRRLYQELKNK